MVDAGRVEVEATGSEAKSLGVGKAEEDTVG